MHVAILGAGAIGLVYGTRLAASATQVSFIVRPDRRASFVAPHLELVRSDEPLSLRDPVLLEKIPSSANVVLLCVRVEQLDDALIALLNENPRIPVLSLTPLMPSDLERLHRALGPRLVVGMPGVMAYRKTHDTIRYWLSRTTPTLIDQSASSDPVIRALCRSLQRAGFRTQFKRQLSRVNPATTVIFFPLTLLIDISDGSIERALQNISRLRLAIQAVRECSALAERIGPPASFVPTLAQFIGPRRLRLAVALLRRSHPESLEFVERHFGSKTRQQNVQLSLQILELAQSEGVPIAAFSKLFALTSVAD